MVSTTFHNQSQTGCLLKLLDKKVFRFLLLGIKYVAIYLPTSEFSRFGVSDNPTSGFSTGRVFSYRSWSSSIALPQILFNEPPKPSSTLSANSRDGCVVPGVECSSGSCRRFKMKWDRIVDVTL